MLIIIPYSLELEVGIKGNNAINLKARSSSNRPSKATRTPRAKIIAWEIRSHKVWQVASIAVLASINGGEFVKCQSYSCCSSPSCCFIRRCRRMDSICHLGHFSCHGTPRLLRPHAPDHLRPSLTLSAYTPVSLRYTLHKLAQPCHSCCQTKLGSMSNFPGLCPYVSGHHLFVFFSFA